MNLLVTPRMQFVDANGHPYAVASAYFYLTGTTTPAIIYQNDALSVTQANPAVADSQGLFPAIYLDPAVQYRVKIVAFGGSLGAPLIDVDPFNDLFTVTGANLAAGAVAANLGFTPVNPAAGAFTAPATMIFAVEPVSLSPFDVGYLGAPTKVEDTAYGFILSDAGKMILHDDANPYTWTIPLNATKPFPVGTIIYLANSGPGVITVARTGGVSLRANGIAADGDLTLGQWALGSIRKIATDSWVFVGSQAAAQQPHVVWHSAGLFANGATTWLHGQTVDEKAQPRALIKCNLADAGYVVGDIIHLTTSPLDNTTHIITLAHIGGNTVGLYMANGFNASNKATQASTALTLSHWDLWLGIEVGMV